MGRRVNSAVAQSYSSATPTKRESSAPWSGAAVVVAGRSFDSIGDGRWFAEIHDCVARKSPTSVCAAQSEEQQRLAQVGSLAACT